MISVIEELRALAMNDQQLPVQPWPQLEQS
jgi:hypothetical protein